jgi:hypothetical protein
MAKSEATGQLPGQSGVFGLGVRVAGQVWDA